ncbi:DUF1836 domain-containing protein [Anaerotignum lactatifermentans]|uniref:DUF1836 domain-containing protein n=1 Tax=Anaerotignum lactatifermentans TaxID=160404 RepID=A0ABS2GA93_9FIRM|nr:DUF1836 domain-containing protein [Anaerotignum lactatifermentans]MBM6828418.1 DUF1836 domain-containing protein [Anaerotignum lactatifermentans]MBM6877698.1 DUF1836 domain-containing protein [Anaerotignum lactatifermentans]MBM6950001.1 DUF1836 domain-containing protein [Anaerotignum lactatifermentans]
MGTFEEILESVKKKINTVHVVEIDEIPSIELYMDQVTTFMDQVLSEYKRTPDGKILTKTMINNYTKAKIFPPPVKKKYGRMHLMLLIMIFHLKSVLSIRDIGILFQPILCCPTPELMERQTEKVYGGFVELQKINLAHLKASSEGRSEGSLFEREILSRYEDNMKSLMLVLLLSIRANSDKNLAERVLDLYL